MEHLNKAVRAFGTEVVVQWIKAMQSVNRVPLISVGSGNGALESLIGNVICVDPDPLSYASRGLTKPYCKPQYDTVQDLVVAQPELIGKCCLLLNWCPPDDSSFDYEAIMILKPMAVISLFELWFGNGAGGGREFHRWRKEKIYNRVIEATLTDCDLDFRIAWWQRESNPKHDLQESYPCQVQPKATELDWLLSFLGK